MSSDRRFSELFLFVMIASFSSRQRLQIPLFLLNVFDVRSISHLISYTVFFFFRFHIYLESSVSFSYFWLRKDLVWFRYLSLKGPPVLPMYVLVTFWCDIDALYITAGVRQFPRRGQSALALQLQFFFVDGLRELAFLRVLPLWDLIIASMLFIQL